MLTYFLHFEQLWLPEENVEVPLSEDISVNIQIRIKIYTELTKGNSRFSSRITKLSSQSLLGMFIDLDMDSLLGSKT